MLRILIGGPVRETPAVLREHLAALSELDSHGFDVDFAFVDDNLDPASSRLLEGFEPDGDVFVLPCGSQRPPPESEATLLRARVTGFRDEILELGRSEHYDGVLLVDGDVILHPRTLQQLWTDGVDLVAPVIWRGNVPQVWERGQDERSPAFVAMLRRPDLFAVGGLAGCVLVPARALAQVSFARVPNLTLTGDERHFAVRAAVAGLGMYVDTRYPALSIRGDLGGLAAWRADRASRRALVEALDALQHTVRAYFSTHPLRTAGAEGVDGFTGPLREDVEAVAADRVRDIKDIRRVCVADLAEGDGRVDGDVVGVSGVLVERFAAGNEVFRQGRRLRAELVDRSGTWALEALELGDATAAPTIPLIRRSRGNRVALSMIVRNEADRYLAQVLGGALELVDSVVVVDGMSDDDTVALCERLLERVPHEIVTLQTPVSGAELRRLQWELVVATRPDWVLVLDADEVFEDRAATAFRALVDDSRNDLVGFRRYDLWDEGHYRDDAVWGAHRTWTPRLVRVDVEVAPVFDARSPIPADLLARPTRKSALRLRNLGYADAVDRQRRAVRPQQTELGLGGLTVEQVDTLLDETPHLVPWDPTQG